MTTEENCPPNDVHASVGTKEAPLLRSGRQMQLLRLLKAPASESVEVWVAWIFGWSPDVAKENCEWVNQTLAQMDPDERWSGLTLADGLQSVCRKLGLPCDTGRHEQPHMLRRLFLLPLSGESLREYMTSPDDPQRPLEFLTPALWLLWFTKVGEIAITLDQAELSMEERIKWALPDLRIVGHRMLAFAWPEGVFSRIESFELTCEVLESTSGLLDLDTGLLVDPQAAALRAFLKGAR